MASPEMLRNGSRYSMNRPDALSIPLRPQEPQRRAPIVYHQDDIAAEPHRLKPGVEVALMIPESVGSIRPVLNFPCPQNQARGSVRMAADTE
jgi:hypothetical protein